MASTTKNWIDKHHPNWIDYLRIIFGILLFVKGVRFIQDTESLMLMMQNSRVEFMSFILSHYVASAHLVGGLMVAIGLYTRVAILFQLPVLIGAVLFVNAKQGLFSLNSELELSVLVLFLLIFFYMYGSGKVSVDHLLATRKER